MTKILEEKETGTTKKKKEIQDIKGIIAFLNNNEGRDKYSSESKGEIER